MVEIIDASGIHELNDQLRRNLMGGTLVMTAGVIALGAEAQRTILAAISDFAQFDQANDPYGEHDFGAVEVGGERLFFKIDDYNQSLTAHSPDPSDPAVTARVLTIMLASEY